MKITHIIGLVIAIAVIAIGVALFGDGDGKVGTVGTACNGGNCTDFDAVNTLMGYWIDNVQIFDEDEDITLATTTIQANYYSVGGIDYASVQVSMQSATTTLCAMPNPFGAATSTLTSFTAQISTGTSTAATISLATSTLQYATSTSDELVADRSVASGAKDDLSYLPLAGANGAQIGPSIFTRS